VSAVVSGAACGVTGPSGGGVGVGSVDGNGDTLGSGAVGVTGSWGVTGEGCEGSAVGAVWAGSIEVALPSGCAGAEAGGIIPSVVGGIVGGGVCVPDARSF